MSKPYQDEIFEWAIEMSAKYGKNPMYYIGCVDTYLSFDNNLDKSLNKIEEKEKKSCLCESQK